MWWDCSCIYNSVPKSRNRKISWREPFLSASPECEEEKTVLLAANCLAARDQKIMLITVERVGYLATNQVHFRKFCLRE